MADVTESTDIFRRLIDAELERRRMRRELASQTEKCESLERAVIDKLLNDGQRSVKLASGEYIGLTKQFYVRKRVGPDAPATCDLVEIFREAGVEGAISINTPKFRSWLKEQKEAAEVDDSVPIETFVPEEIRPYFEIKEEPAVFLRGLAEKDESTDGE